MRFWIRGIRISEGPIVILKLRVLILPLTFAPCQEEQRKLAKQYREELRELLEEHEEVHSEIRWRKVCYIFADVS